MREQPLLNRIEWAQPRSPQASGESRPGGNREGAVEGRPLIAFHLSGSGDPEQHDKRIQRSEVFRHALSSFNESVERYRVVSSNALAYGNPHVRVRHTSPLWGVCLPFVSLLRSNYITSWVLRRLPARSAYLMLDMDCRKWTSGARHLSKSPTQKN